MEKLKPYRRIIRSLFEVLQPTAYLEVGCRSGETLRCLVDADGKNKTNFYAIDVRDVRGLIPSRVKFFHGTSDEIAQKWNLPLDMVFIDADHSEQAVWKDFLNYSKWVRQNGIILLHDTFPQSVEETSSSESGDAWKCAWRIRRELNKEFEIVTLPIRHGLSIVRKSSSQVDWDQNHAHRI